MEGEQVERPVDGCLWRVVEVGFDVVGFDRAVTVYRCELCGATLEVPPGQHPPTV